MQIKKDSNSIQAIWLSVGNFVSFSFGIISAAILSRFLTKEDYGTYKQVLYVYNSLLVIFTVGLPKAYSYFLSRNPIENGKSIVRKINLMLGVIGIMFSISLFAGAPLFSELLRNDALEKNLKIFSVVPIFLLPTMGVESIMATYRKSYISTIYTILSRIFMLCCVVLPVIVLEATAENAIYGFVLSSVLCCICSLSIVRIPFINVDNQVSNLKIKDILRFSIPLFIASIWGLIISSSNQFFISRFWGNIEFAEFTNGFIELPFAGMILGAVSAVLLPVFSKKAYEKSDMVEIVSIWQSVMKKSAMIIYPMAIFCLFFAENIITVLYGKQYSESSSSKYFQLITFVNLIRIIPYAPLVIAIGKVKTYAVAHMITALLLVGLDILCVLFFPSPYLIAVFYIVCTYLLVIMLLKTICKHMNLKFRALWPNELLLILLLSIFASIIGYIAVQYFPIRDDLIFCVLGFIVFGVAYLIISTLFGIKYWELVKSILKK